MKIQIGNVSYTKTKLQEKCRAIVKANKGRLLKNHDYEVALWVYQQRVSTNIPKTLFLSVSDEGFYSGFIWSTDKRDWENMSFKKALMNDLQENKHKVMKAFRWAVADDIKEYRTKTLALPKNKHLKAFADADCRSVHADHIVPFHLLLNDFLQNKGIVITEVEFVDHPHRTGEYLLKSSVLANDWQLFHKQHAQLKLVTASENYSKAGSYDLPLYKYQLAQGKTYDTKKVLQTP